MEVNSHIIFYDGYCGLCNRLVQVIIKKDNKKIFRYAPLQSDFAVQILSSIDKTILNNDTLVFYSTGNIYIRSDAFLKICELLGFPLKFLLICKPIPASVRDVFYNLVATYRYKIWGKYESCPIPSEEQKSLFIL